MTIESTLQLLRASAADRRLSREERQRLRDLAAGLGTEDVGRLRNAAFELLRERITDDVLREQLSWLEDVIRVLAGTGGAASETAAVFDAWFSPQQNCPGKIRELIAATRKTLDICVFTITDDRLTAAVMDAHRRGVRVRIITDNDKAADLGSDADRLRECGVRLRIDRTQYHMHHKFAIFDSQLLLNGSYNWTRGAAEQNEENFMVLNNRSLTTRYQEQFDSLWNSLQDS
ncbi:MAG UNVERIFIED_CONTAM: phospholipase D-like domain-containing protein [Planctomycetaceae bacterium]|jgi:phosphatidylserine/phosphatidylglycerophosphate/cardiolipin synthase-like enzyme